jgi:hypothetical protein
MIGISNDGITLLYINSLQLLRRQSAVGNGGVAM